MGNIYHEWDGTTLIITSDSGTTSSDLKGAKGDMGIRGPQGISPENYEECLDKIIEIQDTINGEFATPTDNRTSLENWYQYLGGHNFYTGYIDEENWEEGVIGEPYEELAYPTGTQNVTNAIGFLDVYIFDELTTGGYLKYKLPVKKFTGTLDLRSVTDITDLFLGMTELVDAGTIDLRSVVHTGIRNAFLNCNALTHAKIKNLKAGIYFASTNLVVDDLIYMIYHLRDTGSSQSLTIGSTQLAKLANVYVRTIEITNAMRVADDLIDEKLPFEVCNSTDDGAMLITDYVTLKNWALK